jgi:hypothetical protein
MPEPSHLPGSVRLRLRAILLFGEVFDKEDIHAAFAWAFAGKAQNWLPLWKRVRAWP